LQGPAGASLDSGGTNPLQIGLGVQVPSIDGVFTQGAAQITGRPPISLFRATVSLSCRTPAVERTPAPARSAGTSPATWWPPAEAVGLEVKPSTG
jgi:hypothetical protein